MNFCCNVIFYIYINSKSDFPDTSRGPPGGRDSIFRGCQRDGQNQGPLGGEEPELTARGDHQVRSIVEGGLSHYDRKY